MYCHKVTEIGQPKSTVHGTKPRAVVHDKVCIAVCLKMGLVRCDTASFSEKLQVCQKITVPSPSWIAELRK